MSRSRPSARARFAAQMRRLRKQKGWSQEDLADYAKLHRNYIGPLERAERNVSVDVVEKIAEALGVDVEDMFKDAVLEAEATTPQQPDQE